MIYLDSPWSIELYQDQILRHHEVCKCVSVENIHALILYDVIVPLRLLQRIQCVFKVPIVLPANENYCDSDEMGKYTTYLKLGSPGPSSALP